MCIRDSSSVGATYEEEGATRQQLNSFGDVIDGLLSSLDDQVISELQAKIGLSESSYQQQPSSTNNNNTTAKRGKGTTIKASSCLLYTSPSPQTPEHLVCRLLLEKKNKQ
eukprot:TRINITY_DN63588_c0_g1_i1.p1 TRINITY_DN63588_c0_g1~~TRINITY_DN63588_c0_g1_i1.p1  ORF type:complete len:110 (-),score=32.78 TRINITY_DN63588_c0_g1_i1:42-371(-)